MNWIKFFSAFLLALSIILITIIFTNAEKPFKKVMQEAEASALQSGELQSVTDSEIYNGTISMVTVYGKDNKGNEKAVFVEEKSGKILDSVKLEDGIGSKQAVQTVKSELKVDKVLHVTLGVEGEYPVWEVAFKSENGKLNYVYVFFENGEWWKRILNL